MEQQTSAPTSAGTTAGGPSASGDGRGEEGGTVAQAKQQAQEAVGGLGERARSTAREQIDQRTNQAGEQVSSLAQDLRSVGEQLRSQENSTGAQLADRVAEQAERAGGYLSDANGDRVLADVEDLGRRQPWLALAGGMVLGVAAARFLKASSGDRYRAGQSKPAGPSGSTPTPAERQAVTEHDSFDRPGIAPEPAAATPVGTPAGSPTV